MHYQKVTAIFPRLDLRNVEDALTELGIFGMTVSKSRGMGEYRNYHAEDLMTDSVRVEVYTQVDQTDQVVRTIARTLHKGLDSDGIIAVLPVEDLLHIRDFKES